LWGGWDGEGLDLRGMCIGRMVWVCRRLEDVVVCGVAA